MRDQNHLRKRNGLTRERNLLGVLVSDYGEVHF